MATTFQEDLLMSLIQDCYAKKSMAKMNIKVMLNNPTGVGDHSNYVQSIRDQANVIAEAQGLLDVLEKELNDDED